LPAARVERALIPHLGPGRTLKDVEAARAALESAYHEQGFGTVFVDIPEQTVGSDGVVRLKVTESRLYRPAISGTRYFSNRQIRNAIPEAASDTVPNLPELQAQINAVNAVTADRQVVPVLKAGPVPGTVNLELKVQDQVPFHATAEVNNQYTADTSELRSSFGFSYGNFFGRQDTLSLQYQMSPQETREVSVFAASYLAGLGQGRNKVSVSYIDSNSEVATLGDITVAGKGQNYNVDFIFPLVASSKMLSSVTVGGHFKSSDQNVNFAGDTLQTPLRYSSLQAAYSLVLFRDQRVWSFGADWTLGLPQLGASRQEFADKCFGCKPNFSMLRVDAGVNQNLGRHLAVGLRAAGQYSVDPLVSNEQFLIGGGRNIRGYLEAEELGDIGIRGSLELRGVQLVPDASGWALEPFVFFDAGVASFQQPLPGQDSSASLQSAGIGMDLRLWKFLTGSLVYAEALAPGSHTEEGDRRLQFWVRGAW